MTNYNLQQRIVTKSKSSQSQVKQEALTFGEAYSKVAKQIEIECFPDTYKSQVNEIALIIAEIFVLPQNTLCRIASVDISSDMISYIFGQLRNKHIMFVIENYNKINYEIKHIKTYLRTSLYNSVFEMESKTENETKTIY